MKRITNRIERQLGSMNYQLRTDLIAGSDDHVTRKPVKRCKRVQSDDQWPRGVAASQEPSRALPRTLFCWRLQVLPWMSQTENQFWKCYRNSDTWWMLATIFLTFSTLKHLRCVFFLITQDSWLDEIDCAISLFTRFQRMISRLYIVKTFTSHWSSAGKICWVSHYF